MSKKNESELRNWMTPQQRESMRDVKGNPLPTWHRNCIEKTGVARPGKTRKDRARRGG